MKKKGLFSGENDKIDGVTKRIIGSLLYVLLAWFKHLFMLHFFKKKTLFPEIIIFEAKYKFFNGEKNICLSCLVFTGILAMKYKTCFNSASVQTLILQKVINLAV